MRTSVTRSSTHAWPGALSRALDQANRADAHRSPVIDTALTRFERTTAPYGIVAASKLRPSGQSAGVCARVLGQ